MGVDLQTARDMYSKTEAMLEMNSKQATDARDSIIGITEKIKDPDQKAKFIEITEAADLDAANVLGDQIIAQILEAIQKSDAKINEITEKLNIK
jgi:hypothetical protein